jgi:hypothetical protein
VSAREYYYVSPTTFQPEGHCSPELERLFTFAHRGSKTSYIGSLCVVITLASLDSGQVVFGGSDKVDVHRPGNCGCSIYLPH